MGLPLILLRWGRWSINTIDFTKMIKLKTYFFILFFIVPLLAKKGQFLIYNDKLMKEAVTFKVIQFDTIANWNNYYNSRSQSEYKYRFLKAFEFAINEGKSFEVLNENSIIEPDMDLTFKFIDLHVETPKMPEEIKKTKGIYKFQDEIKCKIKVEGASRKLKKRIFESTYSFHATSIDKEDAILNKLNDFVKEIVNEFNNITDKSRLKTYQNYNFNCDMIDTVHYFFIANHENEAIRKMASVVDAEIAQNSMDVNANIFKIYIDSTTQIISTSNFNPDNNLGILKNELRNYLMEKGIKSIMLFYDLTCKLPNINIDKLPESRDVSFYGLNIFSVATSILLNIKYDSQEKKTIYRMNSIEEPSLNMVLIDVSRNERLISTKIFAKDSDDIAEKALKSLGSLNLENGEVKCCYDFD